MAMTRAGLPILLLASGLAASATAQTNVFLDYTNFETRLGEAFSSAGLSAPTATESAGVRSSLETRLRSIYSGYTVNFSTTAPSSGDFERIVFGLTDTPGSYGLADRIDWRNANKNDVARVYTANFKDFLSSSLSRTENLQRISNSLSRTAAHEFGHNIGLAHYDTYGYYGLNSRQGYVATGSTQNRYFMGTGSTNASVTDRVTYAEINPLMGAKLAFADGISPNLGLTIPEPVEVNDTLLSASPLSFGAIAMSDRIGVNVAGALTAGDSDYYSFETFQGAAITANILATTVALPGAGSLDTILTLYDAAGNQLFQNDDISFSGNTFNGGSAYGNDSIVLNYIAPQNGRYYVRVSGYNTTTNGAYNLLVTPVPEPATMAALGLGALALLRRRRRA